MTAIVAQAEGFFEAVLESAPDAMIVVDGNGCIVIVNAEAERMFGYSRSEMLGQPIELLVPSRVHDLHIGKRSNYLKKPQLRRMGAGQLLHGLHNDGTEFPVEISLSPVVTDDGMYVSSAIRDVTERMKLEEEITTARQEAERANKANRAFLAAASHDLRQPV